MVATPSPKATSRPIRIAAPSTAPAALSTPNTTTAANHTRLRMGSKVPASNARYDAARSTPPNPASAAATPNTNSLRRWTSMPLARAPASLSRIATRARPRRPRCRLRTTSSAPASPASS